jgi:hypothetical protein
MARQSHGSPPTHCEKRMRMAGHVSSISALPSEKSFRVGLYSLDRPDPEEAALSAALDNAGELVWQRLELPAVTWLMVRGR